MFANKRMINAKGLVKMLRNLNQHKDRLYRSAVQED